MGITQVVTSPTFTIISEYPGKLTLYHIDLYRIGHEEELIFIGLEELFSSGGVCVIEWSVKIKDMLPENTIYINLYPENDNSRRLEIEGIDL